MIHPGGAPLPFQLHWVPLTAFRIHRDRMIHGCADPRVWDQSGSFNWRSQSSRSLLSIIFGWIIGTGSLEQGPCEFLVTNWRPGGGERRPLRPDLGLGATTLNALPSPESGREELLGEVAEKGRLATVETHIEPTHTGWLTGADALGDLLTRR